MLSGYSRRVTIANSSFDWIGDVAVAALGYTDAPASMPELPPGTGPYGEAGNQPRRIVLKHNIAREVGLWQRQSAAWFQVRRPIWIYF